MKVGDRVYYKLKSTEIPRWPGRISYVGFTDVDVYLDQTHLVGDSLFVISPAQREVKAVNANKLEAINGT